MSSNIDESSTALPEGYLAITGPDDEEYVVPDFMVPALHQMFDGYRKKLDLHAFRRAGAVSFTYTGTAGLSLYLMRLYFNQVHENNSEAFGVIGEGKIMAPTVPVSLFFWAVPASLTLPREVVTGNVCRHIQRCWLFKIAWVFLTRTRHIVCIWQKLRNCGPRKKRTRHLRM